MLLIGHTDAYLQIAFAYFITVSICGAQTDNDNMANARFLSVGQPISSGTHGNTVEYNCIDRALTGKCIKYHNDQWYTFTSGARTNLYINISNQNCRDLMGVQLVVFTGEMCQPDTYKLIDCISLATQDDIYVELTGLSADQTYWLNIDGYLHDFCTYDLEISGKPEGMSVNENPLVKELNYSSVKNQLTIQWTLPDSLAHLASQTRIFRRGNHEFRSQPRADVPFKINAFGTMQTNYVYTDTVYYPGQYHYRFETINVHVFNRDIGHQMEFYIALDRLRAVRVR